MFWVLFEGLILFTYLWSFKQQQRKNLNKCCSMKPQRVKEPLTPLDTQLCGSVTSLLQRTTTEMLETPSREFQTEPCGHESSLIWSLQTGWLCYRSAAVSGTGLRQAGERWLVGVAPQLGCADWDVPGLFPLRQLRSTQSSVTAHLKTLKRQFTQIIQS